jgi:hypothetical protein
MFRCVGLLLRSSLMFRKAISRQLHHLHGEEKAFFTRRRSLSSFLSLVYRFVQYNASVELRAALRTEMSVS